MNTYFLFCSKCGNRYPENYSTCPVDGEKLIRVDPSDPLIGVVIADKYRILKKLGEGGMAKVYLAEDEGIGKKFAVKVLSKALVDIPEVVKRFFKEAQSAAAIGHPGIVNVIDCGRTRDGLPYMIMEFLEGENLESILMKEKFLEIKRAIRIIMQSADALSSAHERGIVHRDIKPANIFLNKTNGKSEVVKIVDFGIAKIKSSSSFTAIGQIIGTPLYMSPEQARGDKNLDYHSDIYSLGVTFFHIVCGKPPFDGETNIAILLKHITEDPPKPKSIRADIPEPIESLILKMLAKEPSERPQSMLDIYNELMSFDLEERKQEIIISRAKTLPSIPSVIELPGMEEIRIVTVLIANINIAEKMTEDEDENHYEITKIFKIIREEIEKAGGRAESLTGNKVVGLFGINISYGDEPIRAVRAAWNARKITEGMVNLRIAIGTGKTIAHPDKISIGPASNIAGKLLEKTKDKEIIVDAPTMRGIRGVFRTMPLPREENQEVIFKVEENIEQVGLSVTDIGPFGLDAGMIGRDYELEQLWNIFISTIRNKKPHIVSITGEPGIGKSRLKTEFALRLDYDQNIKSYYMECFCDSISAKRSFSAIGDLLRRRCNFSADASVQEARFKIQQFLLSIGIEQDIKVKSELFLIAAGIDVSQDSSILSLRDNPQRLREKIIDVFVELVSFMARKFPLILCFENAQNLDHGSIEAISSILYSKTTDDLPILILFVGRPEMLEKIVESSFMASGGNFRIVCKPLSKMETCLLVSGLIGSDPPQDLLETVWKKTEGIPLFIEDFLFALKQQGMLVFSPSSLSWVLKENADLSYTPQTVKGMLQVRLDSFPAEIKQAIQKASVIGNVFWDEALEELGVNNLNRILSLLARKEVIIPRPQSSISGCREYSFRSALLQESAYEMLPSKSKSSFHSKVADWLIKRRFPPDFIAFHLELAKRKEEASSYYFESGRIASEKYSNDEAILNFEKAIVLCREVLQLNAIKAKENVYQTYINSLFGKYLILNRLGNRNEAMKLLDEIDFITKNEGDKKNSTKVAILRGALIRPGDPKKASSILLEALNDCKMLNDMEMECEVLHHLAHAFTYAGNINNGMDFAKNAVKLARQIGKNSLLFKTLLGVGTIAVISKNHWYGLPPLTEALEIASQMNDIEGEADIRQRIGFLLSEIGDLEQAKNFLLYANDLCEKTGNKRILAFTLHNLGWVLWKIGIGEEAEVIEKKALDVCRNIKFHLLEMATEIYLALFDIGKGRARESLERVIKARRESTNAGHAEQIMHARMVEALALLALEKNNDALESANMAIEMYKKLGSTQQFEVEIYLVASACFTAIGSEKDASTMREFAFSVIKKRCAPINEQSIQFRIIENIGKGLPDVVNKEKRKMLKKFERDIDFFLKEKNNHIK